MFEQREPESAKSGGNTFLNRPEAVSVQRAPELGYYMETIII